MSQDQANHHTEAMEFVEAAYKSTHSYTTKESPLYQCADGDGFTKYYCNEWQDNYPDSDLRFNPWTYGDIVKPTSEQECVVHKAEGVPYAEYAGCTVTGTCYHDEHYDWDSANGTPNVEDFENVFWFDTDDSDDTSDNYTEYIMPSKVQKYPVKYPDGYNKNGDRRWVTYDDIKEASGLDASCTNVDYKTLYEYTEWENDKGKKRHHWEPCAYIAVCRGHNHYGCPEGHEVATCFGHTDLTMNVYVASLNKIFEMGGVTINEKAGAAISNQIYGMDKEEFEKLSPEKQQEVMEKYDKNLNSAGGNSTEGGE